MKSNPPSSSVRIMSQASYPPLLSEARAEIGATMMEFTFVVIFIFLCLGGIFDIGVGLHQYSYLNYATSKAARTIGTQISTVPACGEIQTVFQSYIQTKTIPELKLAISSADSIRWNFTIGGGDPLRSFILSSSLPLNCYFLCRLLPNWNVTATATATLDNPRLKACTNVSGAYP